MLWGRHAGWATSGQQSQDTLSRAHRNTTCTHVMASAHHPSAALFRNTGKPLGHWSHPHLDLGSSLSLTVWPRLTPSHLASGTTAHSAPSGRL